MKCLLTVLACLVVLVAGAALYAWSGAYNIAATEPHWDVTNDLIIMVRDRSIAWRSDGTAVPNLDDPQYLRAAVDHYHGMCRHCHGAPGFSPNEFAAGLYPAPPDLTSLAVQEARDDAEMYWIVTHGIKATGMPAFGPTHDEKALWGLVALTRALPQMSAEQYAQEVSSSRSEGTSDGHHTHGGAAADKENDTEQPRSHREQDDGHHETEDHHHK